MEGFLSWPIIGILLIIIGLAFLLTKHRFGSLRFWETKKEPENQIVIKNGKVVSPGKYREFPPKDSSLVKDLSLDRQPVSPYPGSNIVVHFENPVICEQEQVKVKEMPRAGTGVEQSEPIWLEETEPFENAKSLQSTRGRLPKIERLWDHLQVAGRSKRTIQEYKYEWKWWSQEAVKKGKTPYTMRVKDIEEVLKGIKPATTKRKIAFMRALAKWYLREDKPRLHDEVWKLTAPKLPRRLPKDRGADEFEKLKGKSRKLVAQDNRVGLWIGLKLMCGLRISEIQTATAVGKGKIQVTGKGNKERLVPAPGWIIKGIKRIQEDGRGGWRQGRVVIWTALAKEGLRNPHSLRHTYASELKRRGKTLDEIQVLLGHESIATTTIYAHTDVPDGVVELLDQ